LDNVSLTYNPQDPPDRTICVDPAVPVPPGGAAGPNILTNGDFNTGSLAPWGLFGQITSQIVNGVFEFIKPSSAPPAGVVLQYTNQAVSIGTPVDAFFQLGNSSSVRKRVTVILHTSDFSDLSACTLWLDPGQPLSDYAMRTYATRAWANATVSVYPATTGLDQWIRLDNVTFRQNPGLATIGTECYETEALAREPSLRMP
jgi:hypothetical protein